MNSKRTIFYSLLFLFSFVLFVYVSFPYTILKEAVITQVARNTGFALRIKSLGPKLPLGFELEGIKVKMPSGEEGLELEEATLSIGILQLFIGQAKAYLTLEDKAGGFIDAEVSIGILDLVQQKFIPGHVGLVAENFAIGHIARFGLAQAREAMSGQAIMADLLGKLGADGQLSGTFDVSLNSDDLSASNGIIDLQIKKGLLRIDKSLGMADQKFEKALVKAKLKSGRLKLDNRSGFHTQGLKVDLKGSITLKKRISKSAMNIDIKVRLDQGLKEQYGFMIDQGLGGSGGAIKCQIRGTLSNPNVVTL